MWQRQKLHLTTRSLIFLLIVFNLFSIGMAEVQRRSLLKLYDEKQLKAVESLRHAVAGLEARIPVSLSESYFSTKVEQLAARLTRLTTALSMSNDIMTEGLQVSNDPKKRNALRAYHATILKIALDEYHWDHKVYPGLPDNSVEDLGSALLTGGYLAAIPKDPSGVPYRYTTAGASDGQRYGLRISLENDGNCITGVGTENSGWWGTLPVCSF